MRSAIYARYSSSLQSPTSIDDQFDLCRKAATRFGCEVDDQHVYQDREVSGAVTDRPGYQKLMAAAKARQFDAVIVEAQDRLWRDQAEMHAALKRLRFHGVRVISVAHGMELTGETGRMVATIAGLQAETFLADLGRKTHRGLAGQIERGFSAGGPAYGYRSVPVADEAGKVIGHRKVIHEAEAGVVRRIFEMYADGMSPKRIVLQLNAEGVAPPRARRGRKTNGWDWTVIHGSPRRGVGILNNELYVGRVVWNRHSKVRDPDTGRHVMRLRPQDDWVRKAAPDLRIVSDELWQRVKVRQGQVTSASRGRPGGPRPRHLFSGLLRCGRCGAHYVMLDTRVYGCGFHHDRGPHVCDNARRVRRDRLEAVLLAAITEQVFTPENVAYLQRRLDEELRRANRPRPTAEVELRQAEREMANIQEAIRQGILTQTTRDMLVAAEEKIRCLRAETAEGPRAEVRALPGLVEQSLRDLRGTLGRDTDRARTLLARLLGEIVLMPSGIGVVAEVRGHLGGLASATGSGGRI